MAIEVQNSATRADQRHAEPSVAALVSGIVGDAQELIRQQFTLLTTEVKQELRQAKRAAISMSIGGGILLIGGILLLVMLVHLLHEGAGLTYWASYGIVGGGLAVIGGGLLLYGQREASDVHLAPPPQTAGAMKENVEWLKAQATSETSEVK